MDPLKFLEENPTPSELPFPEEEFQGRIAKVRKLMGDGGIDVLLVTHLPNLYYLTGYNTIIPNRYACLVLPMDGDPAIHIADVELGAVFCDGVGAGCGVVPLLRRCPGDGPASGDCGR